MRQDNSLQMLQRMRSPALHFVQTKCIRLPSSLPEPREYGSAETPTPTRTTSRVASPTTADDWVGAASSNLRLTMLPAQASLTQSHAHASLTISIGRQTPMRRGVEPELT